MSEHEHDHDHGHDHEHDPFCSHGHEDAADQQPMDAATRSLNEALRLSFKVLSVVMILIFAAFLASGIKSIDSSQVGVIKVAGMVTGTTPVGGGLTYTWPYPIGSIETVTVAEQSLAMDNFKTDGMPDASKKWFERMPAGDKLRPGLDGALITGDNNLLHAEITVGYKIQNPKVYLATLSEFTPPDRISGKEQDKPLEMIIRSAVAGAAIKEAAIKTGQSIMYGQNSRSEFGKAVAARAQISLNDIFRTPLEGEECVHITNVNFDPHWPLQATGAYKAAQAAQSEAVERITNAETHADSTLKSVAGARFFALVGDVKKLGQATVDHEDYWKLMTQVQEADKALAASQQALLKARLDKSAESDIERLTKASDDLQEKVNALSTKVDYNLVGHYEEARGLQQRALDASERAEQAGDKDLQAKQEQLAAQFRTRADAILQRIDDVIAGVSLGGQVSSVINDAKKYKDRYVSQVAAREKTFKEVLKQYTEAPDLMMDRWWRDARDEILRSPTVEKIYVTSDPSERITIVIPRDKDIAKGIYKQWLKQKQSPQDPSQAPAAPQAPSAPPMP